MDLAEAIGGSPPLDISESAGANVLRLILKRNLAPIAQNLISGPLDGIPPEDIETTTRTLRAMTENLLAVSQDTRKAKGTL